MRRSRLSERNVRPKGYFVKQSSEGIHVDIIKHGKSIVIIFLPIRMTFNLQTNNKYYVTLHCPFLV